MSKIYSIDQIPAELLPDVGGKARGLNQLIKFGNPVPEAFIVTDTDDGDSLDDAVELYGRMGFDRVSVRSSATLEDGNDYSAAGQFSTFLNVSGTDDLRRAIRDCVASLHNDTAEHYAKTFLNSAESRMTVVVQRMVDARCAGVIFTKAPLRPGFVQIEAVLGLGENLVSGKVAAQQYYVRDGRVADMPSDAVLTESEVLALAKAAEKAEADFGQPMDLEWAIDSRGLIQWLQARPITVEQSVSVNEFDSPMPNEGKVLTTGNIGEVIPGAVTPLNLTTNIFALDWGVKECYAEIGCTRHDTPPYTFIQSYYNHLFFNMSNMYCVTNGVYGTAKETLDISICGHELEGLPGPGKMTPPPLYLKIYNTLKFLKIVFGGEKSKKGMDKSIASFSFDLSQDYRGIYRQICQNMEPLCWVNYYHYCTSFYSGGQSSFLESAITNDFPDKNEMHSCIAGCLTEIDDFESANVLRMMTALARTMLADAPDCATYTPAQLLDYMDHHANQSVRSEYEAFMKRHGHRGIREMEIRSQSWRANRESFFSSMHSVLLSVKAEKVSGRSAKHWTDYADELLSRYSASKRKTLMGHIQKARKGVCYREYTKSKLIYALDLYRQAYSRLAEQLVEAGLLPETDLIYFLTQQEVGLLIEGTDQPLVKRAIARRRLLPQQMEYKFPEAAVGVPTPIVHTPDPNAKVFRGTPVSRGIVTGTVRVVRTEEDASLLVDGEIMVVQGTDIGWTPYYNIIGGIVSEIGSALSHGIVVAREYALPAVVNVNNIMDELHTGDRVTIDGDAGIVTRL